MARRKRLPETPFEATIERQSPDGLGVLHHDGGKLKAFGALPGEAITARYRFGRQFRGQAEVIDIHAPSPRRTTPGCPSFGVCGACALQHMDYAAQLDFKQSVLADWLRKLGNAEPARWLAPLTAGPWAYRRKARLSVRDVPAKGRVLVGFREQDRRFVTDLDTCPVLDSRLSALLPALSALIGSLDARASIPQVEAACGDERCALVLRHLAPLSDDDRTTLTDWADAHAVDLWLQPGGPDTVTLLAGRETLSYTVPGHGLSYQFGPLDFIQVNAGLNRRMIDQALDLLAPAGGERVLDLFCGLGNFTLPLARRCGEVTGLEGEPGLVARAAANAVCNGIDNVHFEVADLYAEGLRWPQGQFDLVLLDPPRSGAAPVLGRIASSGARKVVYVSCNPETLAKDAGILVAELGFALEAAGVMDMFPQTAHVEAMAVFTRP